MPNHLHMKGASARFEFKEGVTVAMTWIKGRHYTIEVDQTVLTAAERQAGISLANLGLQGTSHETVVTNPKKSGIELSVHLPDGSVTTLKEGDSETVRATGVITDSGPPKTHTIKQENIAGISCDDDTFTVEIDVSARPLVESAPKSFVIMAHHHGVPPPFPPGSSGGEDR